MNTFHLSFSHFLSLASSGLAPLPFTAFLFYQAFGHRSIDPSDGNTTENINNTFAKTLQGNALYSLSEVMMQNLQLILRPPGLAESKSAVWVTEGMYAFCYRVMFEAG